MTERSETRMTTPSIEQEKALAADPLLLSLQSEFAGSREFIGWQPAELTDASMEILRRKLRLLYRDFLEIAELDAGAARPRRSTAILLALRPWVSPWSPRDDERAKALRLSP